MNKHIITLVFLCLLASLSAQSDFNINKFTNPEKYGWMSWEDRMVYRSDLYERQKLLQIYEIEAQSLSANLIKSAVFPGWGQFNTKSYTKGQVFLAIEIGLIGSSMFFYSRAMDQYDKYKTATQIDAMNTAYHNAQGPYQYSMVFLAFASVVWAYNLFDVIQSTETYNAQVWQKTTQTYHQKPVSLTPNGVQINF
jgi:hypothetical protein